MLVRNLKSSSSSWSRDKRRFSDMSQVEFAYDNVYASNCELILIVTFYYLFHVLIAEILLSLR